MHGSGLTSGIFGITWFLGVTGGQGILLCTLLCLFTISIQQEDAAFSYRLVSFKFNKDSFEPRTP